jgi:hypothetical protein
MPQHHTLLHHRIPDALRRRVELAEAVAIEAQFSTHAEQALELVSALAPAVPFDEAIDRYIEIMDLREDDAETVRVRALSMLAAGGSADNLEMQLFEEPADDRPAFEWKYATPIGAVRFVRRHLRRSAAEDLWTEMVAARAEEAVILDHLRHALDLIELLSEHLPPTEVLHDYLARLEVPAQRAHSVYQRTLARIADLELPRIAARTTAD